MPQYAVDLGTIIVEAEDDIKAKEEARRLIRDSCGEDVVIDQSHKVG